MCGYFKQERGLYFWADTINITVSANGLKCGTCRRLDGKGDACVDMECQPGENRCGAFSYSLQSTVESGKIHHGWVKGCATYANCQLSPVHACKLSAKWGVKGAIYDCTMACATTNSLTDGDGDGTKDTEDAAVATFANVFITVLALIIATVCAIV